MPYARWLRSCHDNTNQQLFDAPCNVDIWVIQQRLSKLRPGGGHALAAPACSMLHVRTHGSLMRTAPVAWGCFACACLWEKQMLVGCPEPAPLHCLHDLCRCLVEQKR